VYSTMARDGVFFKVAARVHARHRTTTIAISAQAVWSAMVVLFGTFEQLLTYTGFAIVLFSELAVLSLIVNRRRGGDPDIQGVGLSLGAAHFFVASVSWSS
jgi:APA family basic amino acid/polyamine antiporter